MPGPDEPQPGGLLRPTLPVVDKVVGMAITDVFSGFSTQVISDLRKHGYDDVIAVELERAALVVLMLGFDRMGTYPAQGDVIMPKPYDETERVRLRIKERRFIRMGVNVIKLMFLLELKAD